MLPFLLKIKIINSSDEKYALYYFHIAERIFIVIWLFLLSDRMWSSDNRLNDDDMLQREILTNRRTEEAYPKWSTRLVCR